MKPTRYGSQLRIREDREDLKSEIKGRFFKGSGEDMLAKWDRDLKSKSKLKVVIPYSPKFCLASPKSKINKVIVNQIINSKPELPKTLKLKMQKSKQPSAKKPLDSLNWDATIDRKAMDPL